MDAAAKRFLAMDSLAKELEEVKNEKGIYCLRRLPFPTFFSCSTELTIM